MRDCFWPSSICGSVPNFFGSVTVGAIVSFDTLPLALWCVEPFRNISDCHLLSGSCGNHSTILWIAFGPLVSVGAIPSSEGLPLWLSGSCGWQDAIFQFATLDRNKRL